jgi:hypothetical protein
LKDIFSSLLFFGDLDRGIRTDYRAQAAASALVGMFQYNIPVAFFVNGRTEPESLLRTYVNTQKAPLASFFIDHQF